MEDCPTAGLLTDEFFSNCLVTEEADTLPGCGQWFFCLRQLDYSGGSVEDFHLASHIMQLSTVKRFNCGLAYRKSFYNCQGRNVMPGVFPVKPKGAPKP